MDTTRVRPLDVTLAAGVAGACVIVTAVVGATAGDRPFDLLAGVLVAVAAGVLALHRRAPTVALAVNGTALALYSLRDYPGSPVYLTWLFAIFAVSVAWGPTRTWAPAAGSTAVILANALHDSRGPVVVALFASWAGGAVLMGGSVRGRRAERAALEERARRLTETREDDARRRVAEERLRIARDLHDSVAHSLAGISVQAGVGAHVLDERPEDARAALLAVKHASSQALAELRATLSMLRSTEAAPREPTAGLDQLPSLVESSRAAGLPVDLVIEGDPRSLPPTVDTTAFRIVQESLTNVIRHAGPAHATVAVRLHDDSLEIEVTDNGQGNSARDDRPNRHDDSARPTDDTISSGHGLAGMRERVALLGGEIDTGTRHSGGYRVRARLPL